VKHSKPGLTSSASITSQCADTRPRRCSSGVRVFSASFFCGSLIDPCLVDLNRFRREKNDEGKVLATDAEKDDDLRDSFIRGGIYINPGLCRSCCD
jgi:hypothetical protein